MSEHIGRNEIIDYLHSRKEHFRTAYGVKKLALIGSFARDEAGADSDIDLLVDLEENTPNIYELKQGLKQELEEWFHRLVEIPSERYLKPYYRDPILREAIYV